MDFKIEKIGIDNYSLFDDMVFWRENEFEREPTHMPASEQMKKADDLKMDLEAVGVRLYVNVDNPTAEKSYKYCGYLEKGQAYFMEK